MVAPFTENRRQGRIWEENQVFCFGYKFQVSGEISGERSLQRRNLVGKEMRRRLTQESGREIGESSKASITNRADPARGRKTGTRITEAQRRKPVALGQLGQKQLRDQVGRKWKNEEPEGNLGSRRGMHS